MEAEWPRRPSVGRVFESSGRVRLADSGADGAVRLDAIARYLQDVATDDSDDAGFATGPGTDHVWVVRQTAMRLVPGARWPTLGDDIQLATWCGGLGRAWAIRRTDVSAADGTAVETSALWIHLDDRGRPARLDDRFLAAYAAAAGGRSASTRVTAPGRPGPEAARTPWNVRVADIDVIGHVNNAAVWAAMVQATASGRVPDPVRMAEVVHHGSVETADPVELWVEEGDGERLAWLSVRGEIRVSGRLTFQRGRVPPGTS
jgi:acyl-ACP thioesterase